MAATPKSNTPAHRINRAYVDILPSKSPLVLSSSRISGPSTHVVASSSKVKENTPFKHPSMLMNQQLSSTSMSRKRTLSSTYFPEVVITSVPKKSRLSTKTNHSEKESAIHSSGKASNAAPDLSVEFVYCHQCNKKRDALLTLQCSSVHVYKSTKDQTSRERKCHNKYCQPCLKNRYDDAESSSKFSVEGNNFTCPKCRDICNCSRCRKSKGLNATGALPKPLAREDIQSSKANGNKGAKPSRVKTSSKVPPAKPLPALKWRKIPIQLSQQEADERILIREFVMRFSPLFEPSMAKSSVEELKFITGKLKPREDDCTKGWISEICIRSIVLGLLGLLAKSARLEAAKAIRSATKELRAGGANLNKMWTTLQSLRDTMKDTIIFAEEDSPLSLDYPDPLPPPVSLFANARSLRSIYQLENAVNVVHSTQLIPVVLYLMKESLQTPLVREEIELGAKDGKDCVRDSKEAARLEQERWDVERKTMEKAAKSDKAHKDENRSKRVKHKDHVINLDNAVKILAPSFAARFMSLSSDSDGRMYYALSSSLAEREAAEEFIESALSPKSSKLKKKGGVISTEERSGLKDWSWFIAVWGKKAPSQQHFSKADRMQINNGSDSEEEDDDYTVDKWWAFWEPEEISKVAQWVGIKAGLDDEDPTSGVAGSASAAGVTRITNPTTQRYQSLVHDLKDYAALLEWRAIEDKYRVLK